jgi:YihY family inner membrane protein
MSEMNKPSNFLEAMDRAASLWWAKLVHKLARANKRLKDWPKILIVSLIEALKPGSGVMAAAVAYFAFLSIFPLVLLVVSISSLWLGRLVTENQIIEQLEFIAPALGQLLGRNIDEILQSRGTVSGLALLGLIWSASSIFYMLNRSQSMIWQFDKGPSTWKRRGLAILIVLAITGPLLFLGSFAGSMLDSIRELIPDSIFALQHELTLLVSIIMDILMFFVLYILFPHGSSSWKDCIPGAILAGLLWEAAKKAFLLFITSYLTSSNLVYGSLASIIAFMTWVYFSCVIFFFGGYFNYHYHQFKVHSRKAEATYADLLDE